MNECIYFLLGEDEYRAAVADGQLARESLLSEGFLHASPKNQLARVANKHYGEVDKLLVMVVAVDRLSAELKWERAAGSLYPHLYGPLNMDAVTEVVPFEQFVLTS